MKIKKEDIPVINKVPGTTLRGLSGYGGMTVAYNEIKAGTDFSLVLHGLMNNSCHRPHWGYMIEGELLIKYYTGIEEILKAGDVFYLPPGHSIIVLRDLKFLDFSPENELSKVMRHETIKMNGFSS